MGKRIVYSDKYCVDIGSHVFPTKKYKLIRQSLLSENIVSAEDFQYPKQASDKDILLVHTEAYLNKLKTGTLDYEERFKLEVPYSSQLVEAAYICVDGTIKSCLVALDVGIGLHLGGGFHHAFADHGEGFCVFNDVAIAIRRMIKDGKITRAMTIDCDLHQGNGTADIFTSDKNVFTFSIHQQNNYPFFKPPSDLDIGLDDYSTDKIYIDALKKHIPNIISEFKPQLILYVAGADPYQGDQIGNLALTLNGLKKRDEFVIESARNFDVPIAVVLAGGYAVNVNETVIIHANTVKTALKYSG